MATTQEIREAIAALLLTNIADLNVYAAVPGDMVTPAAIVMTGSKNYEMVMGRGLTQHEFTVTVIASRVDQVSGQDNLDAMCDASGDRSIFAALISNPTLDGLIPPTLRVDGMSGYGPVTFAGVEYLKADFTISITA